MSEDITVNIYIFETDAVVTMTKLNLCKVGEIKNKELIQKLKDVVKEKMNEI
jgi:hypothetical protein